MIWRALGWLLSRDPVRRCLIEFAKARPMNHLYLSDQLYMERYWLMPRWCLYVDEDGHLQTKPWVPLRIRIHHICLPDLGRHLHDHPAPYRTFILDGFYVEDWHNVRSGKEGRRLVSRGQSARGGIGHYHDISYVTYGGVWTLFCMTKKAQQWGFLVDGSKVHNREYRKLYR